MDGDDVRPHHETMSRASILMGVVIAYLALAFVLRTFLHWRRTGSSGFRGLSGTPFSLPWVGGVLLVLAFVGSVAAPVLATVDVDRPLIAPTLALDLVGGAAVALGCLFLFWSQGAMGTSWRIGVDGDERTDLVTGGPFSLVRNPIFSALLLSAAGFALLLPNRSALASYTILVAAIEIQVRAVEEPYLRRAHGDAYARYEARVGRFVPGLGRR